ncbi:MAG: Gfo/Idh/MocA family oxidoreductase [Thermoanaerobaculia bacterium]
MRQILHDLRSGEVSLESVPEPQLPPRGVLVRTRASVISAGTERYLLELAQKSLLGKARSRPDLVRAALAKGRTEGWVNVGRKVLSRLDQPMPLGYSAAGVVERVGAHADGCAVGQRVAVAGAGYANHAELDAVPRNLVAAMPERVSFEQAAYATIAAVALQGVRLAAPQIGERSVVIGLGLIGLIAVQILKANGCRVVGVDRDPRKIRRAFDLGLDVGAVPEEAADATARATGGRGADQVFIAAATTGNEPIELAGELARAKGSVVVIGNVGLTVPRESYYAKELDLQVSMSYGPGRYDPAYEERGQDYPFAHVRWTEQRNLEAVLDLMEQGRLDVQGLTTHRIAFTDALRAYRLIQDENELSIGVVLEYADEPEPVAPELPTGARPRRRSANALGLAFVGAGNHAAVNLLPHLAKHREVRLVGLLNATGPSGRRRSEKFGFAYSASDFARLLDDPGVEAVFIASRHATHAEYTVRALRARKHVFVEKPMVVDEEQLAEVCAAYREANRVDSVGLMVGLNRRFAPMVRRLREELPGGVARQLIYRVNVGRLDLSHWWYDEAEGSGALVGEMVHFLDLMQYVAAEIPLRVHAEALRVDRADTLDRDNLTLVVSFSGGSVGTLCYSTVGDKAAPKERLEVHGGGVTAVLDDFRRLVVTKRGRVRRLRAANQDKGQAGAVAATVASFREHGRGAIPFAELVRGVNMVFAAGRSLATGLPEVLPPTPVEATGGSGSS